LTAVVSGGAITASNGTVIYQFGVQDFQRPININVGTTAGTVTLTNGLSSLNQSYTTRVSGPITLAANKTLNITPNGGGLNRFSGIISGGGNVTFGVGNYIIDATNTYTGITTLSSATFGIGSDAPFGNGGTVTISSGPNFYAVGANHTVPNPVNLNADLTYGTTNPIYQGFDLTFAGPMTINNNRIITITAAGKLTLTSVGELFSSNLTKAGGGTLVLAGNNTYTRLTAVNAGTLLVNGTLASGGLVTAAAGAVFGGTGTINRNVEIAGAVAPGASVGQLNMGAPMTWDSGGKYFFEYSAVTGLNPGVNYDTISSTSTLDLSGITAANPFTIVIMPVGSQTSSPISLDYILGTFAGGVTGFNPAVFAFDGTFGGTPTVSLSGNSVEVTFTPLPEPGTLALTGLTAFGVFACLRRCRKVLA